MVGLRNYKILFSYHTIRIVIIENKRVDYYIYVFNCQYKNNINIYIIYNRLCTLLCLINLCKVTHKLINNVIWARLPFQDLHFLRNAAVYRIESSIFLHYKESFFIKKLAI